MAGDSDLDGSFILVGEKSTENLQKLRETIATQKLKAKAAETPKDHPSTATSYKPGTGSQKTYAHDWSYQGTGGAISVNGRHFVDQYGRVCSLRGVNLSGCTKAPVNDDHDKFPANPEGVTFVGRPFPLEEAHEHLSRLRRWGLTFIRFLVTWEAVEHAGPGIYDVEYLDYIRKLLSMLPQYGLSAFVSIHQDVWSRYSGGSGAPAWTLQLAGFDLDALEETGAAWLVGVKGGGHVEAERGIWPCGYQKLAASTMATLFWAGDTYAPKLMIKSKDGKETSIQQFLQNAYFNMTEKLIEAVGDLDGVLGFEMMNEPHRGYIDIQSLHSFDYNTDLHLWNMPSAFQSFLLGAGHPTEVPVWTRSFPMPTRKTGRVLLNPEGRKVWRQDGPSKGQCIWEMHNVWGWDKVKKTGVVLRENYFINNPITGKKIDWYTDFYFPFFKQWVERVRKLSSPDKIIFVEPIPNEFCPKSWTPEFQVPNMVYAPHWYDLNALFRKAFGNFTVNVQSLSRGTFPLKCFYWGQKGARDNFSLQLKTLAEHSYSSLGEKPVLIGECGIPMDMNEKEAFKDGDFTMQARMMDAMITGLERSLLGFTLWNYNPANTDQFGDDWNGENFSWFSKTRVPSSLSCYDQDAPALDQGGRILSAVVRPYPAKTAGIPLRFDYELNTGAFTFEWANPSTTQVGSGSAPLRARETEIFLPSMIAKGRKVIVDGLGEGDAAPVYDESRQTLFVVTNNTEPGKVHQIRVSLYPPLEPTFEVNDSWTDIKKPALIFLVINMGILLVFLFAIYFDA